MPKLEPLQQWFCDRCGEVIEAASHGVVTFDRGNYRAGDEDLPKTQNYRILHRWGHGPHGDGGCAKEVMLDDDLDSIVNNPGIWLAHLTVGPPLSRSEEVRCHSLQEWAEIYKRLYIAYYEEARKYFGHPAAEVFRDRYVSSILRPGTAIN